MSALLPRLHRIALPALLAVVVTLAACGQSEAEPKAGKPAGPRASSVEVVTVQPAPLDRSWEAVGSLIANESLVLRPEIAGRISRIAVEEGQWVDRGALLFALDDSVDRALVQQAEANLVLAQRNRDRAEELFAGGLIAPAERDAALTALDANRAAVNLARARLGKLTLRAPFRGRAGLRQVSLGDYVSAGQDLIRLEDVAQMKLEFRLPELALPDLRVDQPIELELDAFPGETLKARVYALDSRVADQTRSIAARAVLDNPDGRLRPGQFARVKLIVERKTQALLVPEQAVVPRGENNYVYVVAEGKASERAVRVGQRQPGLAEIVSGLKAGEQVVTSGLQSISNGSSVQVAARP